jgi:hypothetical protein
MQERLQLRFIQKLLMLRFSCRTNLISSRLSHPKTSDSPLNFPTTIYSTVVLHLPPLSSPSKSFSPLLHTLASSKPSKGSKRDNLNRPSARDACSANSFLVATSLSTSRLPCFSCTRCIPRHGIGGGSCSRGRGGSSSDDDFICSSMRGSTGSGNEMSLTTYRNSSTAAEPWLWSLSLPSASVHVAGEILGRGIAIFVASCGREDGTVTCFLFQNELRFMCLHKDPAGSKLLCMGIY